MAIFNSYVSLPEGRNNGDFLHGLHLRDMDLLLNQSSKLRSQHDSNLEEHRHKWQDDD